MKFMFGLQHLLTCNPSTTLSKPCNKVRGEYFSKKVLPASLSCVFLPASLSLCRCRWLYNSQTWPIKLNAVFSQAAVVSILLYGCTTWTLTKCIGKKVDENDARMLRAIWNKFWRQHPSKQHLYSHLPPITKTIKVKQTRHVEHCWWNKNKLISDILLWTPSHGRALAGRPARTYIQQLCADTGYSLENLPGAMDDRDGWRERVWEIRAGSATW